MKKFLMTAVVAGAVALGAGSASAATLAETLAALGLTQAQIATVISASGETTVSTSATPFNWNGTLIKRGSRGSQVMALQACMNNLGYSTGVVDGIYGSNTFNGITAFQASKGYAVDGIVGPQTAPGFEQACNGTSTVVVEDDTEEDNDVDDSDFPDYDGEEAEIEDTDLSGTDEDEISANKEDQHLFTFEIEVDEDGGALRVERADFIFDVDNGTFPDEDDMYDIFEKFTVMVDGEEVASEDADNDEDWRDEDFASNDGQEENAFRISGIDTIIEAGDTVEFEVYGDIADLDEQDDLDIDIDFRVEIRYTDEAGITEEEEIDGTENILIEGLEGIEFNDDEDNNNPDDTTISLNEDKDDVVALMTEVEVDEQDGTVEDIFVYFTLVDSADADVAEATNDIDDLIKEVVLSIDGDDFDADDIEFDGDGLVKVEFDMDDWEVEVEDTYDFVIMLDLEELDADDADVADYIGGTLQVSQVVFEGEGQDEEDFDATTGAEFEPGYAPELTLSSGALVLESVEVEGYDAFGDSSAEVTFEVEVEADGDEDIYLTDALNAAAGRAAFIFLVTDPDTGDEVELAGDALPAGYSITIEDSAGDRLSTEFANDGFYKINDGSSETFTIEITVDASELAATGQYQIELDRILWTEDTNDSDAVDAGDVSGQLDLSLESEDINLENDN